MVNKQGRGQEQEVQSKVDDLKCKLNNHDNRAFLMMSNTIKEAIQDIVKVGQSLIFFCVKFHD